MDAFVDSAAVDSFKWDGSAKDFDHVLAPCPVSFLLFFGPIVYIQCHRYWSSRYQFTVQVDIIFHKEYHHIQNRITSISLQCKSQLTTLTRQSTKLNHSK